MLSYQHAYHAGNFADAIKHLTLSLICDYMVQKDKPFLYLETHSGRGLYDLSHEMSLKTAEFADGIGKLWPVRNKLPPLFQQWMNCISQYNKKDLRFYPGSPLIALNALRAQDRAYFCELHPKEFEALKSLPHRGKKVFFNQCDGIKQMNALLPPIEKRGLIFIDPAYEVKSEYKEIPQSIQKVYKKFSNGVYCLWYPMVDESLNRKLNKAMEAIECPETLHIEFDLKNRSLPGMYGCGLWVLNPPYILKEQIEIILPVLQDILD